MKDGKLSGKFIRKIPNLAKNQKLAKNQNTREAD